MYIFRQAGLSDRVCEYKYIFHSTHFSAYLIYKNYSHFHYSYVFKIAGICVGRVKEGLNYDFFAGGAGGIILTDR